MFASGARILSLIFLVDFANQFILLLSNVHRVFLNGKFDRKSSMKIPENIKSEGNEVCK